MDFARQISVRTRIVGTIVERLARLGLLSVFLATLDALVDLKTLDSNEYIVTVLCRRVSMEDMIDILQEALGCELPTDMPRSHYGMAFVLAQIMERMDEEYPGLFKSVAPSFGPMYTNPSLMSSVVQGVHRLSSVQSELSDPNSVPAKRSDDIGDKGGKSLLGQSGIGDRVMQHDIFGQQDMGSSDGKLLAHRKGDDRVTVLEEPDMYVSDMGNRVKASDLKMLSITSTSPKQSH